MKTKSESNKKYYEKNKEQILENQKARKAERNAYKSLAVLLSELSEERTHRQAVMLANVIQTLDDKSVNPEYIALIWKEFSKGLNIKINNVNDFAVPFIQYLAEKGIK